MTLFYHSSMYPPHKIINDDFLKTDLIEKESIDLTVTSPPYNVEREYNGYKDNLSLEDYLEFAEKWLAKVYDLTKSTGRFCLNVPFSINKFYDRDVIFSDEYTILAKKVGWEKKGVLIWDKGIIKSTAYGSWQSASSPNIINNSEAILVFYKDDWKKNYKGISTTSKEEFLENVKNVWSFPGEQQIRGHPATFPLELPRRCIKQFSYLDDSILDPFLGSGTTLLAGLSRKAIGVEIDPYYCQLAKDRIRERIEQTKLIDFFPEEAKS